MSENIPKIKAEELKRLAMVDKFNTRALFIEYMVNTYARGENKTLVQDRSALGGRSVILKCDSCTKFKIVGRSRVDKEDGVRKFVVVEEESSLVHGTDYTENGSNYIVCGCLGVYKASSVRNNNDEEKKVT